MTARTVLEKMGFRAGHEARVENEPVDLKEVFGVPLATKGLSKPDAHAIKFPDWHLIFVEDSRAIREAARQFVPGYRRGQSLWIAYPKKSSGVKTDISRDQGWDAITALGLLAVTQISINDTWSALRFRYRDEIKTIRRQM